MCHTPSPSFVRAIGYVRCNCILGVPNDEPKEFVACPDTRYCGETEVRAEYRKEPSTRKIMPPSEEVLALVESFLDPRALGVCAQVNTLWRAMSEVMPAYFDLKHMEPFANFEAHDGKIEDMFVYRHRIYSAGTKMVRVWGVAKDYNGIQLYDEETGMEKYDLLHTPVRDTAIIPKVMKANQSMYTAASNGAIREWVLAHNIHNIKFSGAMWEHSGWVNSVSTPPPSPLCSPPSTCAPPGSHYNMAGLPQRPDPWHMLDARRGEPRVPALHCLRRPADSHLGLRHAEAPWQD